MTWQQLDTQHRATGATPFRPLQAAGASHRSAAAACTALQRTSADVFRRRQAQRLARQLAYAHGIVPFDTTLVPWLVHIPCPTNLDALAGWVAREVRMGKLQLRGERALFTILSDRLCRVLTEIEEARIW